MGECRGARRHTQIHPPRRLLGSGDGSVDHLAGLFRELCNVQVEDDGLVFATDSVHAGPIRDDMEYPSVRVTMLALLANARIPI